MGSCFGVDLVSVRDNRRCGFVVDSTVVAFCLGYISDEGCYVLAYSTFQCCFFCRLVFSQKIITL